MDIYQTVISHYPHWSKIELIAVIIVMIISFIILERFYKKDKINRIQSAKCFLERLQKRLLLYIEETEMRRNKKCAQTLKIRGF